MASSAGKRSSAEMEPISKNYQEFKNEVHKYLLQGPTANPHPRAQLCRFRITSKEIKRSPYLVSILMVGLSGVGKSSTINHLLDTRIADTSNSESETKNTSEFVLTVGEPKYAVSDLQLGIVDTPGFNDTDGFRQDACNFYSIKKFYDTHPKLAACYPNLIFVVVSATDNRIDGPNSNLSKSLRCFQQLNLVDQRRCNVVAVLTFCCNGNCKKVARWEKKMEEKKRMIQRIIFEALKVSAPVVVLENDYGEDGEDLDVEGDFTRLPNGELQPKNLYNACKDVLKANEDHFGLMTLNACFDKTNAEKNRVTNGHETKAKIASDESLTSDEEKFLKLFRKAAEGGKHDRISDIADQYAKSKCMNPEQKQEVEKIACTLRKMGLEDEDDCKFFSKGSVEYFHGDEISSMGVDMLKEKYGITKKTVILNSGDLVGQGYNILTDKPTSAQIMEFETEEKEFGFVLPTCAKVERVNDTQSFQEQFKDEKSYVKSRLSNLNVSLNVQHDIFNMGPRAGFNLSLSESDSDETSKSGYSFLYEHRMFKVKIANFKEEKNGIVFTNDFQSEVKKLPDKYKKDDPKNRKCFERFFNRFGHFIVSSAYGGGAIEMTVSEQSGKSEGQKKSLVEAKAALSFFGFGAEVSGDHSSSSTDKSKDFLNQINAQWSGGSRDLHRNDTLTSEEERLKWQTSLMVNPTLLKTEMTLEPISTIIGCIDDGKNEASYNALEDLLGGKFKLLASNEEEERKRKMEEERMRSNTRSGSVEDPEIRGVYATLIKILVAWICRIVDDNNPGNVIILKYT